MIEIAAIAPIATAATQQTPGVAGGSAAASSGSFSALFDGAMSDMNTQLVKAEKGLQDLAAGKTKNLHEVMIDLEHAKLQMQLVMQVRNRVLEAYQELMRTQV